MLTTYSEKLIAIIAKHAGIDPGSLHMDSPLEEIGIDSLGIVEIIFDIEECFDIELPESEDIKERFSDFSSPRSIMKLIQPLMTEREAIL